MNEAQQRDRCPTCKRVKGAPDSKKRPARYCWLEHDEACRAAELWALRNMGPVVDLARKLVSTPRGTPEHLAHELELVKAIAVLDTQAPPAEQLATAPP